MSSNAKAEDGKLQRLIEMRVMSYSIWHARKRRRHRGDPHWREFKRVNNLVKALAKLLEKQRIERKFQGEVCGVGDSDPPLSETSFDKLF
jgi:hypothetical protein